MNQLTGSAQHHDEKKKCDFENENVQARIIVLLEYICHFI